MKRITAPILLCFASLFMAAQCGQFTPTPEAVVYDTVGEAIVLLDAKKALFDIETAKVPRTVPIEKEIEVRQAYVAANRALRGVAAQAANGFAAQTPEQVQALVDSFLQLVVTFIPPEK